MTLWYCGTTLLHMNTTTTTETVKQMKKAVKSTKAPGGAEIARAILKKTGERVSANVVRGVMSNATTSARVSALIARVLPGLMAKSEKPSKSEKKVSV